MKDETLLACRRDNGVLDLVKESRHSRRRLAGHCFPAALLLLASLETSAAVMLALGLEELTLGSDAVVICKVVSSNGEWNATHDKIHTSYGLDVEEVVAGSVPGNRIVLRKLGGVVGKVGMSVPGSGRIQVGRRYLLFLKKIDGQDVFVLKGMAQGVFRITRLDNGIQLAVRQMQGLGLVSERGGAALKRVTTPVPDEVPLKVLLDRIRRIAGSQDRDDASSRTE